MNTLNAVVDSAHMAQIHTEAAGEDETAGFTTLSIARTVFKWNFVLTLSALLLILQEPAKGNHEMIGTPPQTETTTEMRVTETTTEMDDIKTPIETTTEIRGTKTTTEMKVIETVMKLYSVITTPTVNKHRHNHGVHQHRKSLNVMEKVIF